VDVVTDQTSAHDPLNGYVPQGLSLSQAANCASAIRKYVRRSTASMVVHVDAMLAMAAPGAIASTTANIRRFACDGRCTDASDSRFCSGVHSPALCTGQGPFRWVGCRAIQRTLTGRTNWRLSYFLKRDLTRWLKLGPRPFRLQGLPGRICWLGYGERARRGLAINELVRKGKSPRLSRLAATISIQDRCQPVS